jgi:pimeloyl-ACP methyl ester carboxylesterase
VLLGTSVGGAAAIRLAARKPERVRALVLVDSSGLVEPSTLGRVVCWLQGRETVRRVTGMSFARNYLKRRNEHVDGVIGRIETSRAREGFIAMDAAMWRSFATDEANFAAEAASIRCPTLIVWGRRDPVLRAGVEGKRVRELLPHARYIELDTGHAPFIEAPQTFLDEVMPFLCTVER